MDPHVKREDDYRGITHAGFTLEMPPDENAGYLVGEKDVGISTRFSWASISARLASR